MPEDIKDFDGFTDLSREGLKALYDTLNLAMKSLGDLAEGRRLVGIISHVGALKDRIDRQVVVHKARTGGSNVELRV